MRWLSWMGFAGVCLGVGCNSGCSGSAPPLGGSLPSSVVAATGADAVSRPPGDDVAQVTEAHAPHRFVARTPAPRHRPPPLPPPHVHTLPAFVDGSARCLPVAVSPSPRPMPHPPPRWPAGSPQPKSAAAPQPSEGASRWGSGASGAARPSTPREDAGPAHEESARQARKERAAGKPAAKVPQAPAPGYGDASRAPLLPPDAPEASPPSVPSAEWGAAIYLSNDDSMSLSSAQRVIWAIDRYQPIPRAHIHPHELLNYFSFETTEVPRDRDFSVVANIEPRDDDGGVYSLALAVQGRPLTTDTRRNANLAFVIDRSGSMAAEGRMEYVKRGLLRSLAELKHGDIVHLVLFDGTACTAAKNFVVGRDSHQRLADMIRRIEPRGSTNLNDGLSQGYAAADAAYQPSYTNRVVLATDALTNTGVTDQGLISIVAKHFDARRIRLSGVGVGSEFNDALLDELTERGKGAYVFLGSDAEVDAVFGSRFVSLIETTANDVHFRLHLPPSLAMSVFYGEEASTEKARVQAIHYFANTSQLFLSDLKTRHGVLSTQDDIMLTVEYEDPESLEKRVEEYAFNLGSILGESRNVRKARLVDRFIRAVQALAERPVPSRYAYRPASWYDDGAWGTCESVRGELAALASGLPQDPEVLRVQSLWDKFCGRYVTPVEPPPARPSPPVRPAPLPVPRPYDPPQQLPPPPHQRNNDYAPPPVGWPSAQR